MRSRARVAVLAVTVALGTTASCRRAPVETFAGLVDRYLDEFAARHPSIAAGNGIHQHDDRLEDFSASAIASEVASLEAWKARFASLDTSLLTADERVDQRILGGIIDGWLLDLVTVKTWTRNPMIYASAVTDGVHNLMVMASSPAAERSRHIVAKLEHLDALLTAARVNLQHPPALFVRRAIGMFRGAIDLLRSDVPKAFATLEGSDRDRLREATERAATAIEVYANELERGVLPSADGDIVIGRESLEARYRAEELIDLPAARLLAIGERELATTQARFRAVAAELGPGRDPGDVWADVLAEHPVRGGVVPAAQQAVDALLAFIRERQLINLPPHDPVVVAPAPDYDLGLASMHSSTDLPSWRTSPPKASTASSLETAAPSGMKTVQRSPWARAA